MKRKHFVRIVGEEIKHLLYAHHTFSVGRQSFRDRRKKIYTISDDDLDCTQYEDCQNNEKDVEHFLLPTDAHNVKKRRAIKTSKINKNAPTCFGLHGNHLQGAKVSTWLKVTRLVKQ